MSIFEKRIEMLHYLSFYAKKYFGRLDFEEYFEISQPQANVIIREFIKLGFVEKDGNFYKVTEKTKRIFK